MQLYFNFLAWIFQTFEKKNATREISNAKVYCCDCERKRESERERMKSAGIFKQVNYHFGCSPKFFKYINLVSNLIS